MESRNLSITKREQKVIHGIIDHIQHENPRVKKIEQDKLTRLIQAAKVYFEENSRQKANLFPLQFAETDNIPVSRVNQLIEVILPYIVNQELSSKFKLDPISRAAVIAASGTILTGGVELLEHPDVVNLRKRVLKSYTPPKETKIALFTPCSKIKPYRHSRTHMAIDKTIEANPDLTINGSGVV